MILRYLQPVAPRIPRVVRALAREDSQGIPSRQMIQRVGIVSGLVHHRDRYVPRPVIDHFRQGEIRNRSWR